MSSLDDVLSHKEPYGNLSKVPRCRDYDNDCPEVENKLKCYLYDPAKGYCPYLRKGE